MNNHSNISADQSFKHHSTAQISLIQCKDNQCEEITSSANHLISEPSTYSVTKIHFKSKPKNALIVKQWKSKPATEALMKISEYLKDCFGVQTRVESSVYEEICEDKKEWCEKYLSLANENSPGKGIDFCIVMGGDGTYLHLNSLIQDDSSVPPVLGLALGSLGFLLPYQVDDYKKLLPNIMNDTSYVIMRSRLSCSVVRHDKSIADTKYDVLNEFLLSRGTSPYLTMLELIVDDYLVTTIQADGILISTPTGSTAYSLSAGGPMMPPFVPGILVTPICPHSLSFRPVILPDSSKIRIKVPQEAREKAFGSFDGRKTTELNRGDYVEIQQSKYPVPSFTIEPPLKEWFSSVNSKLKWNAREVQKPFQD